MTSLLHARPLELNKELNPANADATMRALEHTKLQSDILPIIFHAGRMACEEKLD